MHTTVLLRQTGKTNWLRNIARGEESKVMVNAMCDVDVCRVPATPICPYIKPCASGGVQQRLVGETCAYAPCA